MYTKLKINIPIECTVSDTLGHNTLQVFASDPLQSSCYAGSQDQAKRKLRPAIEKEIKEALITTKTPAFDAENTVLVKRELENRVYACFVNPHDWTERQGADFCIWDHNIMLGTVHLFRVDLGIQ